MDPFWKASAETHAYLIKHRIPRDCELAFVRAALDALPDHSNLVLASSMSIRYADMIAVPQEKTFKSMPNAVQTASMARYPTPRVSLKV